MRLIIGANGQIAKSIINELPKSEFLFLLTSNKVKLLKFLKEIKKNNNYTIIESDYEKIIFPDGISSIINCTGFGDPTFHKSKDFFLKDLGTNIDNQILNFLEKNNNLHYFFLSTGGIYDSKKNYINARNNRKLKLNLDNLAENNYYILKKITQELLHKSLKHLNIVNLRVFGFISEFINFNSNFFLATVFKSYLSKKKFLTNERNFLRDLISVKDLIKFINILEKKKINDTFDIFSSKPVTKKEILKFFENKGLSLSLNLEKIQNLRKPKLISNCKKAKLMGFVSNKSSIENISDIAKNLELYTTK